MTSTSDRWVLVPATRLERRELVAQWLVERFRLMRREEGTAVAAARLRKYGVPLWVALHVLGIAPSHVPALGRNPPGNPAGRRTLF
jgi:hypothetical protein